MCLAILALERVLLFQVVTVNKRLVARLVAVVLHVPVELLV